MRDMLLKPQVRLMVALSLVGGALLGWAGAAGATVDPTLSDASDSVTTYFTDNLSVAVGAFIAVAGVLWILALIFRSVGIHKRKSVG